LLHLRFLVKVKVECTKVGRLFFPPFPFPPPPFFFLFLSPSVLTSDKRVERGMKDFPFSPLPFLLFLSPHQKPVMKPQAAAVVDVPSLFSLPSPSSLAVVKASVRGKSGNPPPFLSFLFFLLFCKQNGMDNPPFLSFFLFPSTSFVLNRPLRECRFYGDSRPPLFFFPLLFFFLFPPPSLFFRPACVPG